MEFFDLVDKYCIAIFFLFLSVTMYRVEYYLGFADALELHQELDPRDFVDINFAFSADQQALDQSLCQQGIFSR